ncbi:hypothetical protein HYZ41_02305 [archaeon]|nr:hypothetical protein [archaeon]
MHIADLHSHSKYSRATSGSMNIEEITRYAKMKGLDILGTGDFTHPIWLKELKEKLSDTGEIYEHNGINFVPSTEISLIYKHNGKGRRVHHIILAPNFSVVDQINEFLDKKGRRDYDGRPIFGFSSIELVDEMMRISKDIEIIPAHCLLPDEKVVCNPEIKPISEIQKGDKVLTHKGDHKNVLDTFVRPYNGKAYIIQPYYFSSGIKVTNEHPFLAIKTVKNCAFVGGLCKPNSTAKGKHKCTKQHYKNYKPSWIPAEDLKVNDVVLYPRIKKTVDAGQIKISDIIESKNYRISEHFIVPKTGRQDKSIKNIIKITPEFCRLAGYFLAEGYIIKKNNCIQFSFGQKEHEYIDDVTNLMKECVGIEISKKRERHGYELYFYSKILVELFGKLFYQYNKPKRAFSKRLPQWALYLPLEKQSEILRGWWRGDSGVSVSEILSEQMKIICLRLGIIPSIRKLLKEDFNKNSHTIGNRRILAKHDLITFERLSFHEDKFNLLEDPSMKKFKTKLHRRHGWVDENYIYIPINKIETFDYSGLVYNLEVEEDNSYVTHAATVHNCWTPWYGIFGSMSGFDSLKECFQEKTKYIHCVETGLSSDPPMNWRISALDDIVLTSNSDAHSPYPWRLGREANVFDFKEASYKNIINAIRTRKNFIYTIEVDPNYGKYHFDGHRSCNFSCNPKEAKKLNDICPKCGKKLITGVLNRVEQLADRDDGFVPKNSIPFKSIIPLSELVSAITGTDVFTKKVWEIYNRLIDRFGNEFNILLNTDLTELKKTVDEKLAELIIKNREGRLTIEPGYDGVYGKLVLKEEKGLRRFIK